MAKRVRGTPSASFMDNIISTAPRQTSNTDLLLAISGESKSTLRTIETEIRNTRYIPTIFTSFNRAVRVGGAPLASRWLVHGPPAAGKTGFLIGILNSFTRYGHAAALIDAEHALDKKWAVRLKTQASNIICRQPDNMEEAIDLVDKWIINFNKAKADGKIPQDRAFVIGVDTIHKMPPKRELSMMCSMNKGGGAQNLDKGWGRYRANLIASWIDNITPRVGKSDIAFIALAHEYEGQTEDENNLFSTDYRIKGGKSVQFEAQVRIRITSGFKYIEANGKRKFLAGREHIGVVEKNKVGYPYEQFRFYIGNGRGTMPLGFDMAMEAFTEAEYRGDVLVKEGAWVTLPCGARNNGKEATLNHLRNNEESYKTLCDILNDTIDIQEIPDEPVDELTTEQESTASQTD